jgi:hypothetical protein
VTLMTHLGSTTGPLEVGDRVKRHWSVLPARPVPLMRVGVIVEVYQSQPSAQGRSQTLYAVDWQDQEFVERGYVREGLIKVEEPVS